MTEQKDRRPALAMALIALSALVMWLGIRPTWVIAEVGDDLSGGSTEEIPGAAWAAATTPLALTLLAAVAATLILGSVGRRIIGALVAVISVTASWSALQLMTSGADPQRALSLLQSGQVSQRASDPISVADWAVIEGVSTNMTGPVTLMIGAALGIFGGVLLMIRPGQKAGGSRAGSYETPEVRKEKARDRLAESPTSGRALWDAIDAGMDPTDAPETRPENG